MIKRRFLILPAILFFLVACTKPEPVVIDPSFTGTETLITTFAPGMPVFIRIFKQNSELELWMQKDREYELYKTFRICKYSGDLGPKLREGDLQSPEGFYQVYKHSLNPNSRYHLSFNLGYPNAFDRAQGRTGSYLMVHGSCVSIGCYAMTDRRIEEIYALVEAALDNGQPYVPVHIFPFRMNGKNMQRYSASRWYDFWQNLKQGYDLFERERFPPDVFVHDKQYAFSAWPAATPQPLASNP